MMPRGFDGGQKVGVYVDVANIARNGGFGMRYDVLRDFACRGGGEAVRLNAYIGYDAQRAEVDRAYREGQHRFHSTLRDYGYKVIQKTVKWYRNDEGVPVSKANIDLDLAVDALLQSDKLDRVVLATGDGDFVQVVRALQNKGCRVEIVAFDNVSGDLRREADLFMSGYLLPNLLPITRGDREAALPWGEVGSSARGVCYTFDHGPNFGFIRYLMNDFDGDLWNTDSRNSRSPYRTIFCHASQLPVELSLDQLPSRDVILEFRIEANPNDPKKTQAREVVWVNARGVPGPSRQSDDERESQDDRFTGDSD